jgi:hypothetical protein
MIGNIQIPDEPIDQWLHELKPYQKTTLSVFLKNASLEEAAEKWLASTGSPNIVAFGGERDSKPFWERFKTELRKFICDDNSYVEEKKALAAEGSINKAILISAVSAAIGATIGYSATLLAPAVAILLCAIGKMGLHAYCETQG